LLIDTNKGTKEKNNKKLKILINEWKSGVYDEDPQYLAQELEFLVN